MTESATSRGPGAGRPTGAVDADEREIARFFSKVDQSSSPRGCWTWSGYHDPNGYSVFSTSHRRAVRAARWSWEFHAGRDIPVGLEVRRECRNHECANTAHLRLMSQAGIVRATAEYYDFGARTREVTHCPRGHAYDEANTYVQPSGSRACRTCLREFDRKRRGRARQKKTNQSGEAA